jgi:hypothetical protein
VKGLNLLIFSKILAFTKASFVNTSPQIPQQIGLNEEGPNFLFAFHALSRNSRSWVWHMAVRVASLFGGVKKGRRCQFC